MIDKNDTLIELSENPATRFWKLEFDELTLPERVLVSIWELENSVNNGGFENYYIGSSGDTAFAVENALIEIGAHKCADIVKRANSIFENGQPPREQATRERLWDQISDDKKEQLERLDDVFFSYPDDLTSLLYDYVMKHREDIEGL